jgi:protein tyrosine/serine phosphatase
VKLPGAMRRWIWLLPATAVFAWVWNSSPVNLKDRIFPKHLHGVYPGFLYRSGQIDARLIEPTLRELGIDVIVDLGGETPDPAQAAERAAARQLGIAYHSFPLRGSGHGAVETYVSAVEAIARAEQAGQQVLVHCRAGDRRTGGVIAVYEMLVRGERTEHALEELVRYSPGGLEKSPTLIYLLENLGSIADGLRARGFEVRATASNLEAYRVPPG